MIGFHNYVALDHCCWWAVGHFIFC